MDYNLSYPTQQELLKNNRRHKQAENFTRRKVRDNRYISAKSTSFISVHLASFQNSIPVTAKEEPQSFQKKERKFKP